MSEQYPLLCDELSEEEKFSPRCRRLFVSRARARIHVKGAAAIIRRWPGQWTTLLNYWWIGIGMLAITTYILYNCLFSYAMLETTDKSYSRPYSIKKMRLSPSVKPSTPPKVFMHIFVEEKQEIDLNDYLPYIDIITKKYKYFKYQLIIVANDINLETKDVNEHENNLLALNSLWQNPDKNRVRSSHSNLHIKYTTFTKQFSDSPLENYWKSLPPHFLKFLVRAVSVWEKGGIAFDPIVLTPQSPSSIYIDKIYRMLKKYNIKKGKLPTKAHKSNKNPNYSFKSLPNNIRDVINALENDNLTEKSLEDPLDGVETKDNRTIVTLQKRSVTYNNIELINNNTSTADSNNNQESLHDNSSKYNLLPMFLKYLFHKETKQSGETTSNSVPVKHQRDKFVNSTGADNITKDIVANNENKTYHMRDYWNNLMAENNHKPIIISAKGIVEKTENKTTLTGAEDGGETLYEVTIDLKGNIIATDTVCHAFIGGMLSNAIHYDRSETVAEFIIKELSIFCKGLFSSCVGIDVILL